MPTSAIKSTLISFTRRFSHVQQAEGAWAVVCKLHSNSLTLTAVVVIGLFGRFRPELVQSCARMLSHWF